MKIVCKSTTSIFDNLDSSAIVTVSHILTEFSEPKERGPTKGTQANCRDSEPIATVETKWRTEQSAAARSFLAIAKVENICTED